jgi:hypothetical protein
MRIHVSLLLLVLTAASASAQVPTEPPVKLVLSLAGGLTAPSGAVSNDYKSSFSGGAEADIALTELFLLTGTVAYNELEARLTTSTNTVSVWEVGANIKYLISPTPVAKPFIRFGAGLYRRNTGSTPSETNFGVNGAAGVDVDLPRSRLGFTGVARYHTIFIDTAFADPTWQFFELWIGLRVRVL